jgi:hypothetical protein
MDIQDITLPDDLVAPGIELVGLDGNAFAVLGAMARGLKDAGNSKAVVDSYRQQAMAGDNDHLLRVTMAFNGDL